MTMPNLSDYPERIAKVLKMIDSLFDEEDRLKSELALVQQKIRAAQELLIVAAAEDQSERYRKKHI